MEGHLKVKNKYEAIFNIANEGIIILDKQGKITSANPKAYELLEEREDLIGKLLYELQRLDNKTKNNINELFELKKKGVTKNSCELKLLTKNNDEKWLKLLFSPLSGKKGNTNGYLSLIHDISTQKKYEQSMLESQKRYRMVVESLHEGLGIVDPHEKFIYANPALCQMLGYPQQKVVGCNISDLVPDEEIPKLKKIIEKQRLGQPDNIDTYMINSFGKVKLVRISATPWFDENGSYLGWVGLLLDFTDREITQRALRESEEKYRVAVEQSAENIYIIDVKTERIVESNQALRELLGYREEEMKELRASDFVAHSPNNIKGQIDKVLKDGRVFIGERQYRKKDGELVDVEVSASRIDLGKREMLCVVSRDISERKRAQKEILDERNRAEFYLDLLVHDIGNLHHGILAGIGMYRTANDVKTKERSVEMIDKLINRSTHLVNRVLTFTRMKKEPLNMRPIELVSMIRGALESSIKAFPDIVIDHRWELRIKKVIVNADPILEEVFYNLYDNAVKFHVERDVQIGTEVEYTERNMVRVTIWDKGHGIQEDKKKEIFERFSDPSKHMHTGIGLALIKYLVERHNGEVWVEDRVNGTPEKGAKFIVELPMLKM